MYVCKKHNCYSLTRFCHSLDGNILFVGHEAQHREDSKTCYKAGATVQTTQHDAVPEEKDRQRERDHTYFKSCCWTLLKRQHKLSASHCLMHRHVVWWMEAKIIQKGAHFISLYSCILYVDRHTLYCTLHLYNSYTVIIQSSWYPYSYPKIWYCTKVTMCYLSYSSNEIRATWDTYHIFCHWVHFVHWYFCICSLSFIALQQYPSGWIQLYLILPVAVIVVGIVTSQGSETTQADGIREEDLGSCVHPYLKDKWA